MLLHKFGELLMGKVFNNFSIMQCSTTKITSHIKGLFLIILQQIVWKNRLLHNFGDICYVKKIFNNFGIIQCSATKITS